jgi:hypothetical protein
MTFALSALRGQPVYIELAERCRAQSILISSIPNLGDGGSGTFATYKNLCGIISATHVFADYIDTPMIFSPLQKTDNPTIFLNTPIRIKKIIYLETAEGIKALQGKYWPEEALDICFIQLDPDLFSHLLEISEKKAVDLSKERAKYSKDPQKYYYSDQNDIWSWAVDGAPREGAFHNNQGILESRFDGLYVCGGSMQGGTYKTQPLTLVLPSYDSFADLICHDLGTTTDLLPDKFGGISGGGMWQLAFSGTNGIPEKIDEMFFSGICVSGIPGECLYSRGPSALYDVFLKYLDVFCYEGN